jgi:hypothetical protein
MAMPDALLTAAATGGPWALVGLFVVSVFRGWLIPRATHLEIVGNLKMALADKDATITELRMQRSTLVGGVREPGS